MRLGIESCFLFPYLTYLVNPIENIGNKTSYARLLISFFPRSGYEFLGISSARAEFYVSMVLNEEKDIYICVYLRDGESFFLDFFSLFDNLCCFWCGCFLFQPLAFDKIFRSLEWLINNFADRERERAYLALEYISHFNGFRSRFRYTISKWQISF